MCAVFLTFPSGAFAADLDAVATLSGTVSTLPTVTSATDVNGGIDVSPITGNFLNTPSINPFDSVRVG